MANLENPYRVRLVDPSPPEPGASRVVFDVTPDLVETGTTNYRSIDPIHAPGGILAYANTMSRTFNISNIKLVSRTVKEANKNLVYLWLLRSWRMPRFGSTTVNETQRGFRNNIEDLRSRGFFDDAERLRQFAIQRKSQTRQDFLGAELRGSPPRVLRLSAYSVDGQNTAQHINRVPVVLQNLNIPYPSDVDYIPTSNGVPMPTIMTIDVTLLETHSVREYETFNLDSFRRGTLRGF